MTEYLKFGRLMSVKIMGMALSFIIGVLIARLYGAVGAGVYYLFLSLLTGFSLISTFGADKLIIKEIGEEENYNNVSAIAIRHYLLSFMISILIIMLIYIEPGHIISDFFKTTNSQIIILCLSVSIPIITIININSATFIGMHRQELGQIFESMLLPLLTILAVIGLYNMAPDNLPHHIVISRLLALVVLMVISIFYLSEFLQRPDTMYKSFRSVIIDSWPIFGVGFLTFLSQWLSTFMLAFYMNENDVGIYNTAWRLVLIISTVNFIFNKMNAPHFATDYKNKRMQKLERRASRTATVCSVIGLSVLLSVILFSESILSIYGEEFIPGKTALIILAVGQFIAMSSGSAGYLLMMSGHARVQRNFLCMVLVVQFSLLPFIVPVYGIIGAATIQSLSLAMINIFALFYIYRKIHIKPWPNISSLVKNYA